MARSLKHLLVNCFFIGSLFLIPLNAIAQYNRSAEWHSILNELKGSWDLTATMGTQNLHQLCEGKWILQHNFFQLKCQAVQPDTSGYQAQYIIGYHTDKEHYVFHLFDVYGGNYSETLGFGTLKDDRISFKFNYPEGSFHNTFVWNETEQSWKMILRQQNEDGLWELFSIKTLLKRK